MSRSGKVTVVGAGFYGSTTAMRLAEYDIFDEVVLTDIVEGKAEGLALDMNQSRPVEGFQTKVVGATTAADGSGYDFIADRILMLHDKNPQVASRLARCFDRWKKFDAGRQAHAQAALERIRDHEGLSRDVLEVVTRALGESA